MSTAKSMAASYLSNKRATGRSNTLTGGTNQQPKFKTSTSNLSTANISLNPSDGSSNNNNSNSRLKSTSMSNLLAGSEPASSGKAAGVSGSRLIRPASRSALDSIHNGMNAKYAGVQSKVLLQNIRPQATSPSPGARSPSRNTKIPARRSVTPSRYGAAPSATSGATKVPSDRTVLLNKLKAQQEEIDKFELERQTLRQELEMEKNDKLEQIQQLKGELQEKMQEHDKQNEEYHQKLLEAYELADQNRRAADSVLSESRQRDEESRKKIEELELQLSELKEFVAMKEEMTNKMYELREQMRQERERYEEQLKSLHQVFEHEKISRQVSSEHTNTQPRSNYFSRARPNLQSSESINEIQGADGQTLASNCAQPPMSRSQHDLMYGSRLSARMQDTAKSAWKASKHFASSVITGAGGGLSACRKMGKSGGSHKISNRKGTTTTTNGQPVAFETCAVPSITEAATTTSNPQSIQVSVISTQPIGVATSGGVAPLNRNETPKAKQEEDEEHTSVIQVNGGGASMAPRPATNCSQTTNDEKKQSLTIVTKFNDADQQTKPAHSAASGQGSLTGSSERSRCESSSSGRGTSSDAGSAHEAELSGEEAHHNRQVVSGSTGSSPSPNHHDNTTQTTPSQVIEEPANAKRHRRKSSLFKASKILSGSQVSLNKVKCFFMGPPAQSHQFASQQAGKASGNGIEIMGDYSGQQQQQQEQLESSRFRCIELNQALKAPQASRTSTFGVVSNQLNRFEVSKQSNGDNLRPDESFQFSKESNHSNSSSNNNNNNETVDKLDMSQEGGDLKRKQQVNDKPAEDSISATKIQATNQQVGVPICAD